MACAELWGCAFSQMPCSMHMRLSTIIMMQASYKLSPYKLSPADRAEQHARTQAACADRVALLHLLGDV
jgi:hypothetical protein